MDLLPTGVLPAVPISEEPPHLLRNVERNSESWLETLYNSAFDDSPNLSARSRKTFYYRPAYRPLYGGNLAAVPVEPLTIPQLAALCKLPLKDGKVG